VTAFVIVCVAMVVAALVWIVWPLLRSKPADAAAHRTERRLSSIAIVLLVPIIATAMYAWRSNWDWQAVETEQAQNADIEQMLHKLETKLAEDPKNLEGWLMLGRSYNALGRYARAADAYQQAYDLSNGQNVDAVIGLGEALVLTDEASLTGRAAKLFDAALMIAPNHPKALWYGAMASLRAGDLPRGRDRLKLLLAQNPPEQLRAVLERQIQDLDQQLAGGGQSSAAAAPPAVAAAGGEAGQPAAAGGPRSIKVSVTLSPQVRQQLTGSLPLFILARDPNAGGPPLAVQRHSSADLPLNAELSERDAMIPSRSIATVGRVQVVARLSRSGAPQAQSGDFFGAAEYDFSKDSGPLNIVIDQSVP
jgi:cytochrome c-type biogenesis protein CcmH